MQPPELALVDGHSIRPARVTRAVRKRRWPVSRFSSPRKLPGSYTSDDGLVGVRRPHDLGFAFEDDEQVVGRLAGLEEDLAGGDGPLCAELGDFAQLRRAEHRVERGIRRGIPRAGRVHRVSVAALGWPLGPGSTTSRPLL